MNVEYREGKHKHSSLREQNKCCKMKSNSSEIHTSQKK